MAEPTRCCITKSNPGEPGDIESIPQPEGEGWELNCVQLIDPEGGPLEIWYVWVAD